MDLELELNRSLESKMQRMKYELKVSEVGKKLTGSVVSLYCYVSN